MPMDVGLSIEKIPALCVALRDPASLAYLDEQAWDRLIRAARSARLLAVLGQRIELTQARRSVPGIVWDLIQSERTIASHRKQMVLWELDRLARVLVGRSIPVVLAKGAAYIVQGLSSTDGRMLSDVDILVPEGRIGELEALLRQRGWAGDPLDPYDERYYRLWGQEIPPLRYAGSPIELDVHRALVPPSGRVRPDPKALIAAAGPIPGSTFHVLSDVDQVLHACLQLFYDADCTNRIRDLVDIDALLREFGPVPGFWDRLVARSGQFGANRILWYSMRYATGWLATPVPPEVLKSLNIHRGGPVSVWIMDACLARALSPPDPDGSYGAAARVSSAILLLRATWIRYPKRVFFHHLIVKPMRTLIDSMSRQTLSRTVRE